MLLKYYHEKLNVIFVDFMPLRQKLHLWTNWTWSTGWGTWRTTCHDWNPYKHL